MYVINLENRAIIKSPMPNLDRKGIILPILCNKSGKESYNKVGRVGIVVSI